MRVPLLDVRRQNLPLEAELSAAFERVLRSGQFILGSEVERFEGAAAAVTGARFGIGVASGTDAILVALMALGIGPGDEVICPSFTFFATAGCVARVGAVPVFVDSCAECFNLDPAGIERRITPRTKAIKINDSVGILEIKSMNANQFYSAFEPKSDDLIQVNIYMFCLEIPRACLLYECKDNQELKEFYVRQDSAILNPILEKIKYVQLCLKKEVEPRNEETASRLKHLNTPGMEDLQ